MVPNGSAVSSRILARMAENLGSGKLAVRDPEPQPQPDQWVRTTYRDRVWVMVAAIGIVTGVVLAAVSFTFWERNQNLEASQQRLQETSRLLTASIQGLLDRTDRVLAGVADVYVTMDATGSMDDDRMLELMRNRVSNAYPTRSILIVNQDGFLKYATNLNSSRGPVDLRDRDYFRAFATDDQPDVFLGHPITSRADGTRIATVSRSIRNVRNEQIGVVVAVIQLDTLVQLLEKATVVPNLSVALVGNDGETYAEMHRHEAHDHSDPAHITSTVSYLDDWGISLYLHAHREDILAGWGRNSLAIMLVAIALGGAIVFLAFRVSLMMKRLTDSVSSLDDARTEAEAANQAKSDFLAHMSHELRTPLNAVIGFSDAMLNTKIGDDLNPMCRSYLNDIHGSGRHLLALIDDILDLSKVEADRLELFMERTSLDDVCRESLQSIKVMAERKNLKLVFHAPTIGHVYASVDQRRLKQVLLNVLSNAVKYSQQGGEIALSVFDQTEPRISVQDSGKGMTEDEIELALQPFGRIQNSFTVGTEGTGLGLPISKQFTEAMGGRFVVASQVGCGTTIHLFFRSVGTD